MGALAPKAGDAIARFTDAMIGKEQASSRPRQSAADAYQLSAENAMLARTVTRMATLLRWIADSQTRPAIDAADLLEREHESIVLAAGIWPPAKPEAEEKP